MNLLLAVNIPPDICANIVSQSAQLRKDNPDFQWIPEAQYRIILGYVGLIPEEKIDIVTQHVELLLFDVQSTRISTLEYDFVVDQQSTLTIVFRKSGTLEEIHDRIAVFCDPERSKKRSRIFTPHIPLAYSRVAAKQQNSHFRNKLRHMKIEFDMPVSEVVLFEQIFRGTQTLYREVKKIELAPPGRVH